MSAREAELEAENISLRTELAGRDADIIGQQSIIAILQKKLREAEDEASTKRAAARQAEDVQIANGLMTTVIPTTIDETGSL
jgi:GAF domain-containing protein